MPAIILHQFPPVPGVPSMSPFCIKVQMAFKRKGVDFEVANTMFAKRHNPRGKLPFVIWDGEGIEDSSAIVTAIDERGSGPPLVPDDARLAADVHLLEDWADESLYWHLVFAKWGDSEGWQRHKPQFAATMPAALRPLAPLVARRDLQKKLHGHGLSTRAPELVQSEFEAHVDALAARLGSGPYLVGDALTRADLAVVSMLWPLTTGVTPRFQSVIDARPVLVDYIARVRADTGFAGDGTAGFAGHGDTGA